MTLIDKLIHEQKTETHTITIYKIIDNKKTVHEELIQSQQKKEKQQS